MLIAVEGCGHGELDKIYATIKKLEEESGRKVDLLICCGDFQCTRNLSDLKCMACPDKYKDMCSFHDYYSGRKEAYVTTLFIGGNHEASNYLQELPFGGWVARGIFYMGYAGSVSVNGLRIAGLSGIFKGQDYLKGHFECSPYGPDTMRSVYHVRNLDVFRLKQLSLRPPDVVLSHDWPRGIYNHGDVGQLLSRKSFFREEIERDQLGSRPAQELLEALKPSYWFSAHLHVKFPALVEHPDGMETRFLALDKCLPRRRFLQVLDIGPPLPEGESRPLLEWDSAWLAILRSTDHLLSVKPQATNHMPGPSGTERWDFRPSEEEMKEAAEAMGNDLRIQMDNFRKTSRPFNPSVESKNLSFVQQPVPRRNAQTVELCKVLRVRDPRDVLREGKWPEFPEEEEEEEQLVATGTDEIQLPEDDDDDEVQGAVQGATEEEGKKSVVAESGEGFVVDAAPSMENLSQTWESGPKGVRGIKPSSLELLETIVINFKH